MPELARLASPRLRPGRSPLAARLAFALVCAAAAPGIATAASSEGEAEARLRTVARALPSVDRLSSLPEETTPARLLGRGAPAGASRPELAECPTHEGNPLSRLVAEEDNPRARHVRDFVIRDRRGRATKPWRAQTRQERRDRRARGEVDVQRPLLVFLETPAQQEDPSQPWFGHVTFDREGFPTTKAQIVEQVFGRGFDHTDPASMAGFYHRESGGRLQIRGSDASVFTVTVPYMLLGLDRTVELATAIRDQLDPRVDFSRHADEYGWADPILVMTPFSFWLDTYDAVMGTQVPLGFGPTVYDFGPVLTDDTLPDGSSVALSSLAVSHIAQSLGAQEDPESPLFGLPVDQVMTDDIALYAHEYGHAIGLSHMFSLEQSLGREVRSSQNPLTRVAAPSAFDRRTGSGAVTTIMNYSRSWNRVAASQPNGSQEAGLDPMNRAKLGWGNVTEVTVGKTTRLPGSQREGSVLLPGESLQKTLVEHLGAAPSDPRPQILEVHLPPQQIALFPVKERDESETGYWPPGSPGGRMVWSGRTVFGSRFMERQLQVPTTLDQPILSFWTKYGAHGTSAAYPTGLQFGWVQISTDGGTTWTSLASTTTSTAVSPARATYDFFGDDLGAPALTGDSRIHSASGWVQETVPLPLAAGDSFLLRFNFSGWFSLERGRPQDTGWWIDDIYFGDAGDPQQRLVSNFETNADVASWQGLLSEFDLGWGFVAVGETAPFEHRYYFELRGTNRHDTLAFQEDGPKDNTYLSEVFLNRYQEGVMGYYANELSAFLAFPNLSAARATDQDVPLARLQRQDIGYPFAPQAMLGFEEAYSFGAALALAQTPGSGVTLDDVVYFFGFPWESMIPVFAGNSLFLVLLEAVTPNQVTMLDAWPTYRPSGVVPNRPEMPFPERPASEQPYMLGAPGGWPKSVSHGLLGTDDITTTTHLGQPYLLHDAAFHPRRNPTFDDRVPYRDLFATEMIEHHAQSAFDALASPIAVEKLQALPTSQEYVSRTEFVQHHRLWYCHHDATGACAAEEDAAQRPWIEQILFERFSTLLWAELVQVACPPEPTEVTLATKPDWDAFYACFQALVPVVNDQTELLLETARGLGANPTYAFLAQFGPDGLLNPSFWGGVQLGHWLDAKGPVEQPTYGLSVEVKRIRPGRVPRADLELRWQP